MIQIKLSIEENCEVKKASMEEIYIEENEQINKASIKQIDVAQLPMDPELKTAIVDYNVNFQDQIRRVYLQICLCQSQNQDNSFQLGSMNLVIGWNIV